MSSIRAGARDLGWIVAAAVLIRLVLYVAYSPLKVPDSSTYLPFADQILALDFTDYQGWRTPGYPLMLAALGLNSGWVWIAQCLLGLATTATLYVLTLEATGARWAAVAAALAHTLALNQLLLEAVLLPETLASFLLVAGLHLGLKAWKRDWPSGLTALVAVLCAAATLTRPLYVVSGGVILLPLLMFGRENRWRSGAVFLTCFVAPLLCWFAFNKVMVGYFGMTTLLGYNLTNHSGALMERAPPEHALIREIYLEHRSQRAAEGKTHAMTVFDARTEMLARTGLSDAELSRELQRLSLRLFAEYPASYLHSVGKAWIGFWAVPTYWKRENVRWPALAEALDRISIAAKWILRGGYALFLLLALPTLWMAWVRVRGTNHALNCPALIAATVLAASLLQALLEYGENARYALPTQSLAMTSVIIVAAYGHRAWRRGLGAKDTSHPVARNGRR